VFRRATAFIAVVAFSAPTPSCAVHTKVPRAAHELAPDEKPTILSVVMKSGERVECSTPAALVAGAVHVTGAFAIVRTGVFEVAWQDVAQVKEDEAGRILYVDTKQGEHYDVTRLIERSSRSLRLEGDLSTFPEREGTFELPKESIQYAFLKQPGSVGPSSVRTRDGKLYQVDQILADDGATLRFTGSLAEFAIPIGEIDQLVTRKLDAGSTAATTVVWLAVAAGAAFLAMVVAWSSW
jgi:hypothetical protein